MLVVEYVVCLEVEEGVVVVGLVDGVGSCTDDVRGGHGVVLCHGVVEPCIDACFGVVHVALHLLGVAIIDEKAEAGAKGLDADLLVVDLADIEGVLEPEGAVAHADRA